MQNIGMNSGDYVSVSMPVTSRANEESMHNEAQGQDPATTTITCKYCKAEFKGPHGRGNRTRHMKSKHGSQNLNPSLQCPKCHGRFNRSDATKLHMRRKHPSNNDTHMASEEELDVEHHQQSYNGSQLAPDAATRYTTSESNIEAKWLRESYKQTRQLINSMHCSISPGLIASLLSIVEVVVDHMINHAPHDNLTPAYAQALHLFKQFSIVLHAPGPSYDGTSGQSGNASFATPFTPGNALRSTIAAEHHDEYGSSLENALQSTKGRRKAKVNSQLFACPVSKYNFLHELPQICEPVGFTNMSELQQHLNRHDHQDIVRGQLSLCRDCYEHFRVDDGCGNDHSLPDDQKPRQPRGSAKERQWYVIYNLIFPDSAIMPNPYLDDEPSNQFLPQHGIASEHQDSFSPINDPQNSALSSGSLFTTLNQVAASSAIVRYHVEMIQNASDAFCAFIWRQLNLERPFTADEVQVIVTHFRNLQHQQYETMIASIYSTPTAQATSTNYLGLPELSQSYPHTPGTPSTPSYTYSPATQYGNSNDANHTSDLPYTYGPSPPQGPFSDSYYQPRYPR